MKTIERAWRDIEKAVDEYRPELRRALGKPASAADIAGLERVVGRRLPRDLVDSLRIHDGARDVPRVDRLFEGETLLSARQIVKAWRVMKSNLDDGSFAEPSRASRGPVRSCHWSAGWIPLTDSNGDGFHVDLDPGPRGKSGQVIYFYNYGSRPTRVVAKTYAEWLASIPRRIATEARRERRLASALPTPAGSARERKRIETLNTEMPFLLDYVRSLGKTSKRRVEDYRPICRIAVAELSSYALRAGLLTRSGGRYRVTSRGGRCIATAFGR